jgi:PAS domain S-box-containing protein
VVPQLIMIELLALPFLIISILAAPTMQLNALVILGGVPAILTIFLHDAQNTHRRLERRVQDLSVLDKFGALVRHTTDLDSLLHALHKQISEVLGVGNFYIALYEPARHAIWYPIAIKFGIQQNWVERPVTNRLTDQVIEKQTPIMLVEDVDASLKLIGAPPSDGELLAWLGVPLTTPVGLQGCLAVFSETPDTTFTEDDQVLLAALSGQVSAALENILRLAQTGERLSRQTEQLNILEQIGRQLSATLQADELFNQILQFALDFTHSPAGCVSVHEQWANSFSMKVQTGEFIDLDELQVLIDRVTLSGKAEVESLADDSGAQFCMPILYQDDVIGAIALQSSQLDAYSGNAREFISRLAQQAALAMRNASLYEEVHHHLREQSILYMVSARLVSNQALEDVLTSVAESLSASLDSSLTGVYLWSERTRNLSLEATMVRDETQPLTLPEELPEAMLEEIYQSDKTAPYKINQTQMAEFFSMPSGSQRQVILFPLQVSGDLLGIAASYVDRSLVMSQEDYQLPVTIAAQGASAVQNALLFNQISEARDRLQAVLNAVDDGVVMVDGFGQVIFSNNMIVDLSGLTVDAMVGYPLDSISDEFLQAMGLSSQQAARLAARPQDTHQELSVPYRYQYDEGYYVRYSAPVWSEQSQILGWVLVIRDVTDEQVINQTREMLTETLVHDLRSPMSAIKTTLDLLEDNLESQQQEQDSVPFQAIDIAHRAANRVLNLVNSLMDISHLESDHVELNVSEFDAGALIDEVVEEILPLANEDHVMISKNVPDTPLPVRADRELILRVLTNLLDNAIKFTLEGGLVRVLAAGAADKVQITVTDTGPGIPPKYRQEVFSRFVQVPGIRGRRRGAGLGLAFCRVVVHAHDERIWIEESKPGEGLRLSFTLPAASPELTGK